MVLFSGRLGTLFIRSLKITGSFGALPFQWNKNLQKLVVAPSRKLKAIEFRFQLAFVMFPLILAQVVTEWSNLSQSVKMYIMFTMSTNYIGVSCGFVNKTYSQLICTMVNSMIHFEKSWRNGLLTNRVKPMAKVDNEEGRLDYLITLLSYLVYAPIAYHTQLLLYPCLPTFIGYQFLEECSYSGLESQNPHLYSQLVLKLVIFTVGVANWTFVIGGLTLHLWWLFFFGYGLRVYVAKFCSFLHRIDRFNDKLKRDILSFRQIQLIISLHREITAKHVLLSIVAVGAIVNISELYNVCAILSSKDKDSSEVPWQMTLCSFWGFAISTFITLSAFSYLGNVYKESVYGLTVLRKTKRDKLLRTFIVSCPTQKIYFGSFSFFEPVTSLNIEAFVLDKTILKLL